MKNKLTVLIILFSISSPLYAENNSYLPDTIVAQFAGYIGFISAGAGYSFLDDRINTELLYGYVPASEGGIDIHMITGRAIFSPVAIPAGSGYTVYPLTFGLFLNYAIGPQYKIMWPSVYPEWYYRPNALYTGESLGIRIKKNVADSGIKAFEFYADVVTMSEYMYEYIRNDRIKMHYILSLAAGVRIHF